MLDRFKDHIVTTFPALEGEKVLLACSGGLDSMVLAHLLMETGIDFDIAHCNFKLRGSASDNDEVFVVGVSPLPNKNFIII